MCFSMVWSVFNMRCRFRHMIFHIITFNHRQDVFRSSYASFSDAISFHYITDLPYSYRHTCVVLIGHHLCRQPIITPSRIEACYILLLLLIAICLSRKTMVCVTCCLINNNNLTSWLVIVHKERFIMSALLILFKIVFWLNIAKFVLRWVKLTYVYKLHILLVFIKWQLIFTKKDSFSYKMILTNLYLFCCSNEECVASDRYFSQHPSEFYQGLANHGINGERCDGNMTK